MLSVIVPAHNEAAIIGETLAILKASLTQVGEPYEMVVVDDSSTDNTAAIARDAGAGVVSCEKRHIAAARNVGARASRGDVLLFVDADTHVPPDTLRATVAVMRDGAVGGGVNVRFEPGAPLWGRVLLRATMLFMSAVRWGAGCYIFARRDVFEAVGGFDERYFAAEEWVLSMALKRQGRMVILGEHVTTSGRKWRLFTSSQLLRQLTVLVRGPGALRRREQLWLWYGGDREGGIPAGGGKDRPQKGSSRGRTG